MHLPLLSHNVYRVLHRKCFALVFERSKISTSTKSSTALEQALLSREKLSATLLHTLLLVQGDAPKVFFMSERSKVSA